MQQAGPQDNSESFGPGISFGTRVRVKSPDGKHDLGYGTYVDDAHLRVAEDGTIITKLPGLLETDIKVKMPTEARYKEALVQQGFKTPKFVLESGQVVYGFQYYWDAEGDLTITRQ